MVDLITTVDETSSHTPLEVVCFVLPPLAISLTILRLYERIRKRKFWWDDSWALVSSLCNAVAMIVFELHAMSSGLSSYITLKPYSITQRSARLSILFTIIRIFPIGITRMALVGFAISLVVAWAILIAQTFWHCLTLKDWTQEIWPQCHGGDAVAIPQIITVITDTILIFLPLRLFWNTNLSRAQKIRLTTIFTSTAVFTAVSLYHSYAVRDAGPIVESVAAVVEFSIGLIVANLTVLVGWLFRLKHDDCENNREPMTVPSTLCFKSRRTNNFTLTSLRDTIPQDGIVITVDVNVDTSDQRDEEVLKKNENDKTFRWSFIQKKESNDYLTP